MNMIHFQGLNCFHDCVISVANYFRLNYADAFAMLWSETEFRYDSYRKVYLTKRMITNLEILGAKVECFDCFSQDDTKKYFGIFNDGEFIIVGIDAFYIPWNQFYEKFHGPHYFIFKKSKTDNFLCFDPTYNIKDVKIDCNIFFAHTFDICRISRTEKRLLHIEMAEDAKNIIRTHSSTRKTLLSQIRECVDREQKDIILLSKYIDTMINNRYLFFYFLKNQAFLGQDLFNKEYFSEWIAVKNGLYKLAIDTKKNLDDISNRISLLIDKEIDMALKIIRNSAFD